MVASGPGVGRDGAPRVTMLGGWGGSDWALSENHIFTGMHLSSSPTSLTIELNWERHINSLSSATSDMANKLNVSSSVSHDRRIKKTDEGSQIYFCDGCHFYKRVRNRLYKYTIFYKRIIKRSAWRNDIHLCKRSFMRAACINAFFTNGFLKYPVVKMSWVIIKRKIYPCITSSVNKWDCKAVSHDIGEVVGLNHRKW